MDWDKIDASQKKLNAKAAADRRTKAAADIKAGRGIPKSVYTPPKAKDTRSLAEKFDGITRGPNAPAKKKSTGPGFVERIQNKLDGVARGKNAPPKKGSTPTNKSTPQIVSAAERMASRKRGVDKLRTMDRNDRKRAGDFKGKYWGPDQFKGNQNKIDAWKKAGKPRNADGTPKG